MQEELAELFARTTEGFLRLMSLGFRLGLMQCLKLRLYSFRFLDVRDGLGLGLL